MKLNTLFDLGFQLIHTGEPEDVPVQWLLKAAQARLDYLKANPEEAVEAFGVADSFEEEEDQFDKNVPEAS